MFLKPSYVCLDLLVHLLAESHNSNVVFHPNSTFSEPLVDLENKSKCIDKS